MRVLHKKELGCQATQSVTLKEEESKINQNTRKDATFWELLGGKKGVKCESVTQLLSSLLLYGSQAIVSQV